MSTLIIYGSYGYTGSLIVGECQAKGLQVILAGRSLSALQKQALETGYPYEVVDINDITSLRRLLQKGSIVIHCAGPFQFTAKAMAEACLETGVHYLDITGEYQVFESLAEYDTVGKASGIMIMPGVGFDVVPSDCLALHLKNRLPTATNLQLAFTMLKGSASRGTAKTMIHGLGEGSVIRRAGRLENVSFGEKILDIDFGSVKAKAINIPWGDISTAWRSTGIPNIEVYMGASEKQVRSAKLSRYFNWVLRMKWAKEYMLRKVDKRPPGPSEEKRLSGKSFLWGKVWDLSGKECVSTLETVNGYTLTAKTSVLIAQKIMGGNIKPGYQTPAMAYGPDLILELKETKRKDQV